jgi:adenine phosphoribosyltransferase
MTTSARRRAGGCRSDSAVIPGHPPSPAGRRRGEPGIHNHDSGLFAPFVVMDSGPGMTSSEYPMTAPAAENDLRAAIRSIPDYPKPGIIFRDITTLLGDARAFRRAVDELVQPWAGAKIDKVAGIEARGFIIGGAVAHQVSAGFVPIRKKGKLPHQTVRMAYLLEYGSDEMEMHVDAINKGDRVVLVDDLIATGGTAEGAVKLLRQVGAEVLAACFIIDLPELGGADKLRKLDVPVRTLVSFEGH